MFFFVGGGGGGACPQPLPLPEPPLQVKLVQIAYSKIHPERPELNSKAMQWTT